MIRRNRLIGRNAAASGGVGVASFLACLMGLGLPVLWAVVIGVAAYAAVDVALGPGEAPPEPAPVTPGLTRQEIDFTILGGRQKVARIRALRQDLPEPTVSDKVEAICLVVDKIFDDFERDPKDIKVAQRFLDQYLDATAMVIERYADLNRSGSQSPEVQKALSGFANLLDTIEITFNKQYDRLLRDDALDLETEISVLKQLMQLEGL